MLTREFLRGQSRTKVVLSREVPEVPEPQPAEKKSLRTGDRPPNGGRSLRTLVAGILEIAAQWPGALLPPCSALPVQNFNSELQMEEMPSLLSFRLNV
jgi:hypothetical protein